MAQKKKMNFNIVQSPTIEEIRRQVWLHKKNKIKNIASFTLLIGLAVLGTYLLLANHSYDFIFRTASYTSDMTDSHTYAVFKNGIIRYNKDGVAFLNRRNEELWLQPAQFKTPILDVNEDAFAVADSGGNAIQIYTKDGLKGEIETPLPIEKISISGKGVVAAILKNETSPLVVVYDAAGNILVENQISIGKMGYPTAVELSEDGTVMAIACLNVNTPTLKSRVVCYNFGEKGNSQNNYEVSVEEYADAYIPELYFMGDSTLVAVSDHSFIIYEGKDAPAKKNEINITQEIKSVFHTDKYIGFILLNADKSGYEARLYNKSGKQIMNRSFTGEYANVHMYGDEIIMYSNSQCCIITKTGVVRFEGDMKSDALLVMNTYGINKYLVMSANELRTVYLVK